MNVSTGMRNPFTIHDMAVITTRYFGERPLPGRGRPAGRRAGVAAVDRAARSSPRSTAPRACCEKGRNIVDRFPIPRSDKVELRLHKDQRKVDRLRRLNEIYWPYGELDCVFDDRNTRELLRPAAPGRPRALRLRRRRDRLGPLPRRGPPAGAARDRRAARVRAEEDDARPAAVPRPRARPRWRSSTSRASCSTRPSRTSTPGCARATCPSWTSSCGRPASPPACPAGSWRTAARARPSTATSTASTRTCRRASCARRPRRRCRTSSSRGSSTRRSAGSASTSAAATA